MLQCTEFDFKGRSSRTYALPSRGQTKLKHGHITWHVFELFQWQIAWSLVLECSASCNKSRQPLCAIALICEGPLTTRSTTIPHCFTDLQVPWDPGRSARLRLEDKPKFKGGGLSAILLLELYWWARRWAVTLGLGLLISQEAATMGINTRDTTTKRLAWIGLDGGFGRGLAGRVFLLLLSRVPPPPL